MFGTGGKVTTAIDPGVGLADYGQGVAIQSDGKIVVAGYTWDISEESNFAVVRYLGTPPQNSYLLWTK